MATIRKIPTSADIYLEIDGKKVAVVQSYSVTAGKSSKTILAFGQEEPVATIAGPNQYVLELARIYATDEALTDGINLFTLADFNLVICKPDRSVIYSGCQWTQLDESAEVGGMVMEKARIAATKRVEVAA